jgi:hypothetical protein
LDKI